MGKSQYQKGRSKGFLHCHTEHSVRDSGMSVTELVKRAKVLGASAVALTDHGTQVGWIDFVKRCQEEGIKPIVGIEAYFSPEGTDNLRNHLILMVKDQEGYVALNKAVRESYGFLLAEATGEYPRMTYGILEKYFGPGTPGHGHIIATSACAGGVLAAILRKNERLQKEADKLRRKQSKCTPVNDAFLDAVHADEEAAAEIDALIARRDELKIATKCSTTGLRRRLKTMNEESEEYKKLLSEVESLEAEKAKAEDDFAKIKVEIANKKKAKTEAGKILSKQKQSVERWLDLQDQIDKLLTSGDSDEALLKETEEACDKFHQIFGKDWYIELQYHGISEEARVMPILADLAKRRNLPVVAANDAHYATNSEESVRGRTLISATRFNRVITPEMYEEEGYGELYLKDDAELYEMLSKILPEDVCNSAMENIEKIIAECNFAYAKGTHYPVFVGGVDGESASARLRRLAEEGIPKRYPSDWDSTKQARMDYELSVIEKMGFSDYLCVVQDFLAYGRSLVSIYPEKVGYTIGPGRGSAAGSLVAYLVGITDIDPMAYGLLFERFLNPERVSMPDIDSDFSPDIREMVIEYVQKKYGHEAVSAIITKGTNAAKGALRAAGRVTDVPLGIVDKACAHIPAINGSISESAELADLAATNPVVAQLVKDALLMEGVCVQYGVHAAGIIISDSTDISNYVPLHWNTDKEQWVAQCDMVQAEGDLGLLKFDFLGLKNLKIITDCIRAVYRNHGIKIDMNTVGKPFEPEVFKYIFAAGKTNAVFQFESGGMKKALRSFKPDRFEDIILLNAAYRPGPMQYIDAITDVKHGRRVPVYIAKGLEEILAPTYGYPIYQEQVMQIFNKIAGFSLGEADIIRRAMSKKKLSVLTDEKTDYYGKFIRGLMTNGATKEDAEEFWTQLLEFANYAFNLSHAACYADIAYKTAWLKYHYPAEYMSAVMIMADYKALPQLLEECKDLGVAVLPPNINHSDIHFAVSDGKIHFGFNDIKGMGSSGTAIVEERQRNGAFTSIKEVAKRLPELKPSSYEILIRTGAFDDFCNGNRASLLAGIRPFLDGLKAMEKKMEKLAENNEALKTLKAEGKDDSDKEVKKILRSIASCEKAIDGLQMSLTGAIFAPAEDNLEKKLEDELELLGFYVSGSPFDQYASAVAKIKGATSIADISEEGVYTICGIVKSVRNLIRKKDSKPFAAFTLFDSVGSIEATCFTKEYELYKHLLVEGGAVCASVKVRLDEFNGETSLKPSVLSLAPIHADAKKLIYRGETIFDWVDNYETIKKYESASGLELYFHDGATGEIRKANFRVSDKITGVLPIRIQQ